jgi:hypothetical protein
MDCYTVFSHGILILFFKIISVDFIFLILSCLRIQFCNFFSLKHYWLLQCFFTWFFLFLFFLWFFPKLSFLILFFNIELVKNYSYNMWGNHCSFSRSRKLLWIATFFFPYSFFLFFSKIIFVNFIFFKIKLIKNYNYK